MIVSLEIDAKEEIAFLARRNLNWSNRWGFVINTRKKVLGVFIIFAEKWVDKFNVSLLVFAGARTGKGLVIILVMYYIWADYCGDDYFRISLKLPRAMHATDGNFTQSWPGSCCQREVWTRTPDASFMEYRLAWGWIVTSIDTSS